MYINKQCTACNGVKDGIEWDSYIVFNNPSPSDIDTTLSAIRLGTSSTNCHAQFIYPYDDVHWLRKLQCYTEAPVDSCPNKSAFRDAMYLHQFNLDQNSVAELCSSSFHSVYVYTDTKQKNYYFKNVFCAICNKQFKTNKVCSYDSKYPLKNPSNKLFTTLVKWAGDVFDADVLPLRAYGLKQGDRARVIHCPVGQERNRKCVYAQQEWPTSNVGVFVKLIIPEPIRLPKGTSKNGIEPFFKGIDFYIDTSMSIDILAEFANYIAESDCVIIDYFAIVFHVLKANNSSVLMSQINQFLNSTWTVRFNDTSIKCTQELMSYSVRGLLYLHKLRPNYDSVFLERVYNLQKFDKYFSDDDNKKYSSEMLLIGKIFICPLLEFSEEEVKIIHNGYVLYISEYAKHFGDMEFVTSIDGSGKGTVKVCWDDKIFHDLKPSILVNNAIKTAYQITFMGLIPYMMYCTLRY